MFDQVDDASRREKCFTTISQLPVFVDPKQIPSKRSPFSTIQNHAFVHSIEVILPKDAYSQIKPSLEAKLEKPRYARVFMTPSSLLEHEFFNTYIKSGNILMISEGRSGSDNVFTLRDGILRMELGKEIYERTGLTGKVFRSGGRKHAKERYLVELNLRLPSMLHGKKGFERIVWAFANVLTQSMAWLFHDLEDTLGLDEGSKPIQKLHPQFLTCGLQEIDHEQTLKPSLHGKAFEEMPESDLQEHCGYLMEWLAMVQMNSPRVSWEDDVDPYLSRYAVPDAEDRTDLISLKWHGMMSSSWVMNLFTLMQNSRDSNLWFTISACTLGKEAVEGRDGYTVMVLPNEQEKTSHVTTCICWEMMGASVVEP